MMLDFFSAFYEQTKGFEILPRSVYFPSHTILFGPPKSGKTSLALDSARLFKKPIFIDCADPRFDLESTQTMLLKLFLEKRFDFLILDNFTPSLHLPNFPHIIITTSSLSNIPSHIIQSFHTKSISPLSFKEYVSFFKKSQTLESIFASFLKEGNLPEILFLPDFQKTKRNQEIIALHLQKDFALFRSLLLYQSQTFSTYNFYTFLKSKSKISKDKAYAFIQMLCDTQTISLIPHILPNQPKKLFLYNFALPYMLYDKPNFQAIFANLVFCELIHKDAEILYSNECDFIANDCAYFATPFLSKEAIMRKLTTIKRSYKNIYFITIDIGEVAPLARDNVEILSFIDFALDDL